MKTKLTSLILMSFLISCAHKTPSKLVVLDGADNGHQIAKDPKTKLIWNLVPLPQQNFAEAEMVCTIAMDKGGRLEKYDRDLNLKWRLPSSSEFDQARTYGLRDFFTGNVFWTANTTDKHFIGYDKVNNEFVNYSRNEKLMDVLCVANQN